MSCIAALHNPQRGRASCVGCLPQPTQQPTCAVQRVGGPVAAAPWQLPAATVSSCLLLLLLLLLLLPGRAFEQAAEEAAGWRQRRSVWVRCSIARIAVPPAPASTTMRPRSALPQDKLLGAVQSHCSYPQLAVQRRPLAQGSKALPCHLPGNAHCSCASSYSLLLLLLLLLATFRAASVSLRGCSSARQAVAAQHHLCRLQWAYANGRRRQHLAGVSDQRLQQ